ncbi:MAG: hypothetical protein HOA57_01325 [Candidatus Magasanikbacteria bacterium]|jgi:hypothetical protein|nr:hypothetical protein [Candidatus Magasanikbacteria bacterium]MBT4315062.1 hypothetical protein [Candidatus Magasanikbacteria bacterium]MBT4546841.1 hypothetical protein [Candidatus Magasanikbacteria bacterium]MBT6819006.1 hypothetical protein [Candidatus Magasanikbacteria bacterium]
MKKGIVVGLFLLFFVVGMFFFLSAVKAGTGPYIGLDYGAHSGLGSQDVRFTVAMMVRVVLGLLGTIALVIVLYAGFKWMTAGGNEENVKDAQKILMAAVIGLVIILTAYSITRFVTTRILEATKGGGFQYSDVE